MHKEYRVIRNNPSHRDKLVITRRQTTENYFEIQTNEAKRPVLPSRR
jgi:hypothetical protein